MLVAMYYNNKDVRVQDIPKPEIDNDEFLLKVMASGICGSDVTEWYRLPHSPKVLGHEATGVIFEVGKHVSKWKVGDRVFVSHHVPCNSCRYCQRGHHTACQTLQTTNYFPGGFSQYIRVPKINVEKGVYALPEDLTFEEGTFIEPLACVIRGQSFSELQKDDTLLIIGAGLAGILHMQLAKATGVEKIIVADINPFRLHQAKKFGAHHLLKSNENLPQQLRAVNNGRLADQVIVCAGSAPASLVALECVDKGGVILFFAVPDPTVRIPLSITDFWRKELTIKTSYGAAPTDLKESLALLSKKKLNVLDMITHRFSLQESGEAFRIVASADKSLKVILEPNSG